MAAVDLVAHFAMDVQVYFLKYPVCTFAHVTLSLLAVGMIQRLHHTIEDSLTRYSHARPTVGKGQDTRRRSVFGSEATTL